MSLRPALSTAPSQLAIACSSHREHGIALGLNLMIAATDDDVIVTNPT